jgi:intraflagellar transport protein 81
LQEKITFAEQQSGVVGFVDAQANLEKVSELKSEKDQQKGQQLQEISQIIQKLVDTINDKKTLLAPVIQQLRTMRQETQELEMQYQEKKEQYDSVMVGLEGEMKRIDQEMKQFTVEYQTNQSKYHHLNLLIQQAEISQDKAMNEMKAYIGADDMMELVQKARGFKTYRDLYAKKLLDLENQSRNLQQVYVDVKEKHEPNMQQIDMFGSVKKLLLLKSKLNKQVLSGKVMEENAIVTQDRMVLS